MFDTKDTQKLLRLHETLHSVNTTLHNTILEGTTFVVDKEVHHKKVKALKSELLGVMSEISAIWDKT